MSAKDWQLTRRVLLDLTALVPYSIIMIVPLSPPGHVFAFSLMKRCFPAAVPSPFTAERQDIYEIYNRIAADAAATKATAASAKAKQAAAEATGNTPKAKAASAGLAGVKAAVWTAAGIAGKAFSVVGGLLSRRQATRAASEGAEPATDSGSG